MRVKAFLLGAVALVMVSGAAQAFWGARGNDTGGIIPWTPENQHNAHVIASELCARYNKYARITSVHAQPGDYIGFRCVWSPHTRP